MQQQDYQQQYTNVRDPYNYASHWREAGENTPFEYNPNGTKSDESNAVESQNVSAQMNDSNIGGDGIGTPGVNGIHESSFHNNLHFQQHQNNNNLMKTNQEPIIKRDYWVPDNKAKECFKCYKEFTFFYRKHHCRYCGRVFCKSCTIVKSITQSFDNVRICIQCDQQMEDYQKSLKSKGNLIRPDKDSSPFYIQHFEEGNLSISKLSNNDKANARTSKSQNLPRKQPSPHNKQPYQIQNNPNHNQLHPPQKNNQLQIPRARSSGGFLQSGSITNSKKSSTKIQEVNQKFTMSPEELKQFEEYQLQSMRVDDKTGGGGIMGDGFAQYLKQTKEESWQDPPVQLTRKESGPPSTDLEQRLHWKQLDEFGNSHIQQIVMEKIKEYRIDEELWFSKLFDFVKSAVTNVKPSSKILNDSMDFNKYIKIKIIKWKDNSKSTYINGVVMSKDLADKRMSSIIEKPRILLLKGSLTFSAYEIESAYEQHDLDIVKQQLASLDPNLVIVENDVPTKIIDLLRQQKIALITNLSLDKMKRIARYTQTFIAPSLNVIDKKFVLGKCKLFRVEKMQKSKQKMTGITADTSTTKRPQTTFTQQQSFQRNTYNSNSNIWGTFTGGGGGREDIGSSAGRGGFEGGSEADQFGGDGRYFQQQQLSKASKERNLIYFEGCNNVLGCTIVLSGKITSSPQTVQSVVANIQTQQFQQKSSIINECEMVNESRKEGTAEIKIKTSTFVAPPAENDQKEEQCELKRVKDALKEMLKLARNVILEKTFLMQIYCQIPKKMDDNSNTIILESPFLIKRRVLNRQTLVLTKVMIKRGTAATITDDTNLTQIQPSNQQQQPSDVSPAQIAQATGMQTPQQHILTPLDIQNKIMKYMVVDENFVKTKVDSICGCPSKEKLTFYKDNDETLGTMLKKICKRAAQACECKEPFYKHSILYYHKEGYVEIQLQLQQSAEEYPKKQSNRVPGSRAVNIVKENVQANTTDGGGVGTGCYNTETNNQGQSQVNPNKNDIIMNGFCNKCKCQVVPDVVMSSQFYEYSFARFLEQFYYNGERLICQNLACGHKAMRDITRNFIVNNAFKEIDKNKKDIYNSISSAKNDLTKRVKTLRGFLMDEAKLFVKPEDEPLYVGSSVMFLSDILRHLDSLIEQTEAKINEMLPQAEQQLEDPYINLFQVYFLQRKILMNLMTFSKLLDELGRISCLILVILRRRIKIIEENHSLAKLQAMQQMQTQQQQQQVQTPNDSIVLPSTPSQSQQPQILLPLVTDTPTLNLNLTQGTLIQGGNTNTFIEELFQEGASAGGGNNLQPLGGMGAASSKIMGQQTSNSQNIMVCQRQLQNEHEQLHKNLINKIQQEQEFVIEGKTNNDDILEELKDEQSEIFMESRQPSMHIPNQRYTNTNKFETSQHNQTLLQHDQNYSYSLMKDNFTLNWVSELQKGLISLPLGTDNVYIPVKENDYGSIIAFALASNIYKEAMIIHNYMDVGQNVKNLNKIMKQAHSVQHTDVTTTPMNINNTNQTININNNNNINNNANTATILNQQPLLQQQQTVRESLIMQPQQSFKEQIQHSIPPIVIPTMTFENNQEAIKLVGKSDVFNSDLTSHQYETELLCGEKLTFNVKFSTYKKDLQLNMIKNGSCQKLKKTSLAFQTGKVPKLTDHQLQQQQQQQQQLSAPQTGRHRKKQPPVMNDVHQKILPSFPKDYMELKFFKDALENISNIIQNLNQYFFVQQQQQQQQQPRALSPTRYLGVNGGGGNTQNFEMMDQLDSQQQYEDDSCDINLTMQQQEYAPQPLSSRDTFTLTHQLSNYSLVGGGMPPTSKVGPLERKQSILNTNLFTPFQQVFFDQVSQQQNGGGNGNQMSFCGVKAPQGQNQESSPAANLVRELQIPETNFELKMYYPKKFEALRRFYCGPQNSFIQSMIRTNEWTDVTGGKTKSKFYRSFDDKYVFKEVKKNEFKMFLEFAPIYFDYLCKSFFHNYPCTLCKILGAYKFKITHPNTSKIVKKYIYVIENMNFGITAEDEKSITRYDLKGSSLNRFVKNMYNDKAVLHDNNFIYDQRGKSIPLRYNMNRILHICINNDTLCLSKSNIVDYSLLTIIDRERKKVRFGIIDYVQQYTIDKIFESKYKNFMSGGQMPTIVDPEKYKLRFKRAIKRYFLGMAIQEEKKMQLSSRKRHENLYNTQLDDMSLGDEGEDENNDTKIFNVAEVKLGGQSAENSNYQSNFSAIKIINEEDQIKQPNSSEFQ